MHGQLKAVSDVMPQVYLVTLLPFSLQPVSHNTHSGKASLKSMGLSLWLLTFSVCS